ncbi:hypothetical protein L596_013866 [Steinernema carpocapsae]|uniref:Uncharacterized protein n=1 Tax=Steinernema carpocapsae TaxID=34508 RepID=A0A4U5P2S7_STECR|nr:hypothetical protein L596_013866 [Steinernema carpocapsae]
MILPEILQFVDTHLTYPVFIFSSIILLLSLSLKTTSLCKTCCANIAVPSFLSTLLFIVTRFADRSVRVYPILRNIYIFVRAFSLHGYVYFSTLTVLLAYVGYAKPFFFQHFVSNRQV